MNAMDTYHFGAPCVSGKARRARDRIRRDPSDKVHNDDNTSYSMPQSAANTNDIPQSYRQNCASIRQQSSWQNFTTSSNKPPSRAYSNFPQGRGSSQRGNTVDPELQAMDTDPQRDGPNLCLGTTLKESSCIPSVCQVSRPMNRTTTSDNSTNNANYPDNRVNNGHVEIGNSSSSVSGATMTYSNDTTHFHIGTIQYHVWMPPESLNSEPPSGDRGHRVSRNRTRKRRGRKRRRDDRSRTIWRRLWCFY